MCSQSQQTIYVRRQRDELLIDAINMELEDVSGAPSDYIL